MEWESFVPGKGDWNYRGYSQELGGRVLARIVPDPEGTMGIVYRIETLDGVRVLDGSIRWKEISDQILLLPPREDGRSVTDQAVSQAIKASVRSRQGLI